MLQKTCKKCRAVESRSYIGQAFSKKVAEDWEIRLRCGEGGRHIDDANQSNVAEDLQKVLRCGEKKLHWVGIFEKGCGGLEDKVALQRRCTSHRRGKPEQI